MADGGFMDWLGGAASGAGDWIKANPMQSAGWGLAGGSTLAGLISQIYGQNAQKQAMDKYVRQARQPLDPSQYFQQATQAEMDQMKRMVGTGLAERGVQPGGYWDNQMMEAINKDTTQRWNQATSTAENQKAAYLQALMGRAGSKPTGFGDTSAIGKYMQYIMEQNARKQAAAKNQNAPPTQPGMADTSFMDTPYNLKLGAGGMNLGSEPSTPSTADYGSPAY